MIEWWVILYDGIYTEKRKKNLKKIFLKNGLKKKETRWELIAIFKSIYHAKERAEFLKNAWNIWYKKELLSLYGTQEERDVEIKKINEYILPSLFNEVQVLYELNN